MPLELRLVVSAQEGLRCRLPGSCEAASGRMEGGRSRDVRCVSVFTSWRFDGLRVGV